MKKILLTLKICFFSLFFITFSCDDDNPNPNNYGVFPMDLKVEPLPNGGYRYSWNKINSSDFITYTLVGSSTDSIPYISTSSQLPPKTAVIQVMTDHNAITFTDTVSLPSGNPYIRLFAFLKGRSLSSINKKLTPIVNLKELSIAPSEFFYSEKKKILVAVDIFSAATNFQVSSGNLHFINTDSLHFPIPTSPVSLFQDSEFYIGDLNSGTGIFVPSSNGFGYNFINLDTRAATFVNVINASIFTFNSPTTNSRWVVSSNFLNITSALFPSTNNPISSFVQPIPTSINANIINTPYFLRLKNDKRTFLALKPNVDGANTLRVFNYEILNDGKLQLLKAVTPSLKINNTFSKSTPFIFTKDDAYFICDNKGLVFNALDFTKYKTLAEEVPTGDNINYIDFVLNTVQRTPLGEGGKIYALRNGVRDKKNRVVDIFTYPDFKHERSIPYKSTPTKLILKSDHILLVGTSPNNSRAIMFEKVNL